MSSKKLSIRTNFIHATNGMLFSMTSISRILESSTMVTIVFVVDRCIFAFLGGASAVFLYPLNPF